jgi:SAM-dependent methyltransferase
MRRQFQIEFLKSVGLKPQHYLLDIGCGTLRGGIPLIEYLEEKHYFGIEVRGTVLEEGKKELEQYKLGYKEPMLILSKKLSSAVLRPYSIRFDYVWAFSVLIHMNDTILNKCLKMVSEIMDDSGCFYANVNVGKKPDQAWQGFPVVWRSLDFYEQKAAKNCLKPVDIGNLQALGGLTPSQKNGQRMLRFTKM